MEDNKKTVTIDQNDMLNKATAFGMINRLVTDIESEWGVSSHDKATVALFAAAFYFLPRNLTPELWNAAMYSIISVAKYRKIGGSKEVVWPEWDPEDKDNADCHQIIDMFLILYAWTTAVEHDTGVAPEEHLGALFTLAGVGHEGITRGYHLTDFSAIDLYNNFKPKLLEDLGEDEKAKLFLKEQLDNLQSVIESYQIGE